MKAVFTVLLLVIVLAIAGCLCVSAFSGISAPALDTPTPAGTP